MSLRLADRLSAERRRHFVGRVAERALFQALLEAPEWPFLVLHVFGPGGVGKSTLLREFAAISHEAGAPATFLDARAFEPAPEAFLAALRLALNLGADEPPALALAQRGDRHVIFLDTVERLAPLDNWLRDVFLPQMPANVLVVLAGRNPPAPAWRVDPGWQTLLRALPLRNLSTDESIAYLQQRGIPAAHHPAILDFTHGHPLALSLVAETFAQRPAVTFQPQDAPDVIKTLLEQFVQKVPGPAHRAALEACALARLTTEPLLADMLGVLDAHELFEWLRDLSFIECGSLGLFPHDLAREALVTDLRWRHPDWYKELHRRARDFYIGRLHSERQPMQQRLLFDLVFLHRENQAVRPFFEWTEGGSILADAARTADAHALLAMVSRHEGAESAQLAAHWLARQPEGFLVFRDGRQAPIGFMAAIALERATPQDIQADPATQAAWVYLGRHAALRAGEKATYFRFWMDHETHQAVSPVQSLVFIQAVGHYLSTPGLAYTFFPCAQADFWAQVLAYADLTRLSEADFEIAGRRFGVYGHDWRAVPPAAWLTLLGEREVGGPATAAVATRSVEPIAVLSQDDFAAAVRDALRDFVRPDLLRGNPLLRSRVVQRRLQPMAGEAERTAALRSLLRAAAEQLQESPKESKYYRAVYHTYIQPAPTQELAAELLDVPFSSYRRHLKAGMTRTAEILWQAEVGGAET